MIISKLPNFLFSWKLINNVNACSPWPLSYFKNDYLSLSCLYYYAFTDVRLCPGSFSSPHPQFPPPPPLAFFFLSLVYNSIRRIFHIPCCSYLRVLGSPSFFLLVLHLFSLCTLVTGNLANTHLPALWVEQSTILLKICFPWHLLLYSRSLADGCAFMTSHRFPSYISPFRLHAHEQSNSGVTLDV